MKKYKALMLDLDGTTIPNRRDGMPSKKVTKAISKASKLIHVGVATARPYFLVAGVLDKLELSSPLIIDSGAEIIDSRTRKTLHRILMDKEDTLHLCKLLVKLKTKFKIHDMENDIQFTDDYVPKNPTHIFIPDLTHKIADYIIEQIGNMPTIAIHKMPSWSEGKINMLLSHASSTKQHAILKVAEILRIKTHEIIGVGDGHNDFPLLMACGLKVAMGNAVPELKEIADYIAPSVEEDGVADVIEKFVLST